ncbi:unnamed protein product [Cyprideis torosa]|uniref:Uncharacterized protein n=1 Tax=Cyprideis torosa TaxID=163714 RepID=A0A7R8WNT8_9CRUS|nr:unnamed protein product [Cyprideis torosa]CAG0900812.1 unnamed protein product [Cyprideis torosa]
MISLSCSVSELRLDDPSASFRLMVMAGYHNILGTVQRLDETGSSGVPELILKSCWTDRESAVTVRLDSSATKFQMCFPGGKTGAGKSCLGNRLLGYSVLDDRNGPFKVSPGVHSETSDVKMVDGFFFGERSKPIRVIDCPGLADSRGQDDQFASKLSDMMKEVGYVNVLLWCRNGQEDRIDINEWHQLKTCRDVFGMYLFDNMVMNLSKWPHDEKSEKRRQQSGKTFSNFRTQIWEKLLNQVIDADTSAFPVLALDSMYDVDDEIEVMKFNEIKREMWKCFLDLKSEPVFTKATLDEYIKQQKDREAKVKSEQERMIQERIADAVRRSIRKPRKCLHVELVTDMTDTLEVNCTELSGMFLAPSSVLSPSANGSLADATPVSEVVPEDLPSSAR